MVLEYMNQWSFLIYKQYFAFLSLNVGLFLFNSPDLFILFFNLISRNTILSKYIVMECYGIYYRIILHTCVFQSTDLILSY